MLVIGLVLMSSIFLSLFNMFTNFRLSNFLFIFIMHDIINRLSFFMLISIILLLILFRLFSYLFIFAIYILIFRLSYFFFTPIIFIFVFFGLFIILFILLIFVYKLSSFLSILKLDTRNFVFKYRYLYNNIYYQNYISL